MSHDSHARQDVFIEASAVVDEGASLGDGVKVWHFAHVCAGARIGEGSSLGQGVYVAPTAVIGRRVRIQNHVSVYDGVELHDDVFCGPGVVFTNVRNPRAAVPRKHAYQPTLVKQGATLGANCTLVCGVTVGAHAFVAAGAVVTHDVPDHALVMGVPARQVGWMSRNGCRLDLPLSGAAQATCPESGAQYQLRDGRLSEL